MKVWITKYALTDGIFVADGESPEDRPNMVCIRQEGRLTQYFHGEDWHTDWETAERRAHAMRIKAIKSAQKKIAKLEKLAFSNPSGSQA